VVRYGDAMRIAAQVLKDVFGALERFSHADNLLITMLFAQSYEVIF
jgi:hypothetical protein